MNYNIDSITDNCYEGTTCLINKLDIRDEKQLEIVYVSGDMPFLSQRKQKLFKKIVGATLCGRPGKMIENSNGIISFL